MTEDVQGLPIGIKAPMIDTTDIVDMKINLTDILATHKGVLLEFFRGAWWYYWKRHFKYLKKNFSEIENRGVKMIAIACDSPRGIQKLDEKNNYPWPFIGGRSCEIPKDYQVYSSEPLEGHDKLQVGNAIPSKFLIDKSGTIVWKYIGSKTDRPSIKQITDAIDQYL